MNVQGNFCYEPLRKTTSFRLVDLLPCHQGDNLECRLYNADLEQHPSYEAVSYVWGSEADKVPLVCNGEKFPVTQNLAAALMRFQHGPNPRTIWVDSICIDQNNISERNHQVALMSQIYRKASQVLVWLGDEPFMDEAMACIILLHDRVAPRIDELEQYEERTINPDSQQPDSEELLARFSIPPADSGLFKSLNQLFRTAWFSRAWTFQESYLANVTIFHFGTSQVVGDGMLVTFHILYRLAWAGFGDRQLDFQHDKVLPMLATSKMFPVKEGLVDFMQLLNARRGSGCKCPSDVIYSLSGVAPADLDIRPDYSIPFGRVFAEFASTVMDITASLSILGSVVSPSSSQCSTWVPDWRTPTPVHRAGLTDGKFRRYNCTGASTPVKRISSDWKDLTIQGFSSSQIVAVEEPFSDTTDTVISKKIREMDEQNAFVAEDGSTPIWHTKFRVLCADLSLYDEANANRRWNIASYHHYFAEMVTELRSGGDSKKRKLAYEAARNSRDKYLILTSDQRLGLAPDTSEPGDIIALLLGGEVPIVLRSKGDKYVVIGECFVDGIMDGEGLVEARKRTRPDDDHSDTSWLHHLHEEPLPFDADSFILT